jgi:hypothetical protein
VGEGVWIGEDSVSVVNGFFGWYYRRCVDPVGAVVWICVFGGCSDSSLHCGSLISLLEWFRFLLVFARSVIV